MKAFAAQKTRPTSRAKRPTPEIAKRKPRAIIPPRISTKAPQRATLPGPAPIAMKAAPHRAARLGAPAAPLRKHQAKRHGAATPEGKPAIGQARMRAAGGEREARVCDLAAARTCGGPERNRSAHPRLMTMTQA